MPSTILIPSSLQSLASAFSSIPNNTSIYLYKNSNGNVIASTSENPLITASVGYAFNFIDGTVVYTIPAISSLASIPWTYTGVNTLQASSSNLWNSKCYIWIDAKETKSINQSLQKIQSKDYTTNYVLIENTTPYSFLYPTDTLDLSSGACIESNDALQIYQYFAVCITCQIPTFTSATTIFQHNRLSLRLITHADIDNVQSSQIAVYDNGVYIKGLNIVIGSTKYSIYFDHTSALIVNNATSNMTNQATPSYYVNSAIKMYIGSDSTKSYPAYVKIHEVLYYVSTANDINATSSNIMGYLKTRWSWVDYVPTGNTPAQFLSQISPVTGTEASYVSGEYGYYTLASPANITYNSVSTHMWYGFYYCSTKYISIGVDTGKYFVAMRNLSATTLSDGFLIGFIRKDTNGNFTCNSWAEWYSGSTGRNFASRSYTGASGANVFYNGTYSNQASSYDIIQNYTFTMTLDMTTRTVICRIYNASDTLLQTNTYTALIPTNCFDTSTVGLDKYYPYIVNVGVGKEIQMRSDLTISGEVNILSK